MPSAIFVWGPFYYYLVFSVFGINVCWVFFCVCVCVMSVILVLLVAKYWRGYFRNNQWMDEWVVLFPSWTLGGGWGTQYYSAIVNWQLHSIGWDNSVHGHFFMIPPHWKPLNNFRGFIILSGVQVLLCKELITAEGHPPHNCAVRHNILM